MDETPLPDTSTELISPIEIVIITAAFTFGISTLASAKVFDRTSSSNKLKGFLICGVALLLFCLLLVAAIKFYVLAVLIPGVAGIWLGSTASKKQDTRVTKKVAEVAETDQIWDKNTLIPRLTDIFLTYQDDWSNLNDQSLVTYATAEFYRKTIILMRILDGLGRRNIIANVKVINAKIDQLDDSRDNSLDMITVDFRTEKQSQIVDVSSGDILYQETVLSDERLVFSRHNDRWLLAEIIKLPDPTWLTGNPFYDFAAKNDMFYSETVSNALIPNHGDLFTNISFMNALIRWHVAGMYHDILVQIYTFQEIDIKSGRAFSSNFVAQSTLPREYGQIVIKPKSGLGGIEDLTQVETEWPDFNKKFSVYASSPDLAVSFELLNPAFMEKIHALELGIHIEVYGNVLLIYTPSAEKTPANTVYETLLSILYLSFEELKI